MGRIADIFARLRAENRRALMPFICGGHFGPGSTVVALEALQRAGASVAEVGVPFSDPIADGPVIAAAMHRALAQGVTPPMILDEVREARDRLSIGLVAMASVSIAHRAGGSGAFVTRIKGAGFDGLIVPDSPLEESAEFISAAADADLSLVFLIAPTTPPERAQRLVEASTGFVYLLARAGITGEQAQAPDVSHRIHRLREWTDLPIAVGFGISTAAHVRAVVNHADAAIVGSALVRRMGESADPVGAAESFVGELAGGLA